MCVWIVLFSTICAFAFSFSFFFEVCFSAETHFQWVLCTVHRTHKHLFSSKFSLKMGFTYSTIHIFKNYFATVFSVFSKISDIETDLTSKWDSAWRRNMFCSKGGSYLGTHTWPPFREIIRSSWDPKPI